MKRIFTEMWLLVYKGKFVRDDLGAYVMTKHKQEALGLAARRAKSETVRRCHVVIEEIRS